MKLLAPAAVLWLTMQIAAASYDPLEVRVDFTVQDIDFRAGSREIPCKIFIPSDLQKPVPVILFSHGLGGANDGAEYLGRHWAARGYVAVFLQHPGSDKGVWQGKDRKAALVAMKEAASRKNHLLRVADVRTVLSGLADENTRAGSILQGKLDLSRVGMSGHSFGAKTTQAVSGELSPFATRRIPAIKAAIPMSPSPSIAASPEKSFGSVPIPWLCMTGTKDGAPAFLSNTSPSDRLKVFDALPATGSMFELVLWEAEHSAFTDGVPGRNAQANPGHHRSILATSTAFWDAFLRADPHAAHWLKNRAHEVLDARDTWASK